MPEHLNDEVTVSEVTLSDGQISYTLLNLELPAAFTVSQSSISPAFGWTLTDKTLSLDEIRSRREVVRVCKQRREEEAARKAEEEQRSREQVSTNPDYQDLLTKKDEPSTAKLAAKNIRLLLKKHFKGIKFSVRMRDYSCINVGWTDGPTTEEVDAIISRFQEGRFDGMTDMYEYGNDPFNKVYGGVQYLFTSRECSDALIEEAITRVKSRNKTVVGDDCTVAAFRSGKLWNVGSEYFSHGLQSEIYKEVALISKK
ncbi:hypothetical protein AUM97_022245 (plasmid) [Cronobacter sakazakii]|nr:hypothetical protein AUM97_022245 [Cronobacter sakazakii]